MLNLKKALENNIIHFKNDDEFYEWCVDPKIVLINETDKFGNEYKVADFNLSEAYNDAISKYKDLSKRADNPIGNYVEVYMAKNKTCPADRHNGFYTLRYDIGVDYLYDLIDMCVAFGFITKRGSWFDILNPQTGELLVDSIQGQSNVYEFLQKDENLEILVQLEELVEAKISVRD